MKTRILAIIILVSIGTIGFSQVENDDIYFNSKDRAKMKEKATVVAYADDVKPKAKKNVEYSDEINPTDTYSARNVNPEFSARSHAEVAQEENGDYFVNNYKYQTSEKLNTWNNDFNNWYGNPTYTNSYYGNDMYGWNSPYYGSYYNNFGSPWTNPYYQSMLSSSFSYYWGNNWNYGWGVGYNNYCNPYNSFWGSPYSSFGYGFSYGNPYYYNPYGWGGYRNNYPAVVVVERNKFNTYEMRNSRSSNLASNNAQGTSRSSTSSYANTDQSRNNTGRTSSRTEYYDRNWRYRTPSNSGTSSYSNSNGDNTFTKPSNSWNNSNSGNSNSRYTPSSSGYDGGGSRSSSSSSSSGGSHSSGDGSRSRGR